MRTTPYRLLFALGFACAAPLACGGGNKGGTEPQATFSVSATAPQDFNAVPWPSDLLRDAAGHIAITTLPISPNVAAPYLTDLNTVQDGFGTFTGAYFPVGKYAVDVHGIPTPDPDAGSVDGTTLAGNVHLYPLSCANGVTIDMSEVPLYTFLRADDSPQRIYARPAQGTVLHEACTYAYVVTNGVTTDKGALNASPDLKALLSSSKPSARLAAAYATFAPLRAKLASMRNNPGMETSVTTADVASATVFTTHSLSPDYLNARATFLAQPAPKAVVTHVFASTATADDDGTLDQLFGVPTVEQAGIDNPGGVAHAGIDYVVQGSFDTNDYLGGSTKDALGINETVPGIVEYDASGKPMVKGTITVPFTIVIPKCGASPLPCADITKLKFAVIQHGLGVQRRWMMSEANILALRGIASVLIDLPFHGQRTTGAVDAVYDFTGATGSDGFADDTSKTATAAEYGFFSVSGNMAAGLPPLLPRTVRAGFFQSVVDIMQAFRLMGAGDLSALGTKEPRLATLGIDDTREAYVGESFGSMIGTIVSAFEPKLVGSVLDVDGGGTIFPLLLNSPTFAPIFGVLLDAALGTNLSATDPKDTDFSYNFAEWLLDQGDSLAYAPYVVAKQTWTGSTETDSPLHVLQASAFQDELVPNPANLTLAQAMGLQPLTLSDGVAPVLTGWTITAATGQLTANDGGQTAAFIQFAQASHGMMSERNGAHTVSFADASMMMWPALNPPVMFTNPTDRLNQIMGDFTQQALAGTAPVVK
jgi:hypothetical protein